jgi:ABC-type sugar transport system permease subunit
MTGGGPGTATEVLAMYQYRVGLKHFDIGYGSTIAVGLLVIALAISALYAKAMFREPAK